MERLGIPIVVLLQRNVEEILSNIRLLARLKQKHLIDTAGHELTITDTEKLTRLANHDSVAAFHRLR
jgi:hypothetical protein